MSQVAAIGAKERAVWPWWSYAPLLSAILIFYLFIFWQEAQSCTNPRFQASCWTESGRKCDNLSQP